MRRLLGRNGLSIAGAAGLLLLTGCAEQSVPAPTEFSSWTANEGAFQLQYPADWEAEGGGKQGLQWARFKRGGAMIHVRVGVADSVIGDIVGIGDSGALELTPEEREALAPVTQVHELRKAVMAEEHRNYDEPTASNLQLRLGPARKGEFTASKGLRGKIRGYHVTVLSRQHRVTMLCTCPESDWQVLQPAFDTVIASLE